MHLVKFDGHHVDILNQDGSQWDGQQEAWFIPRQVAQAIGAKKPRIYANKILNRNPDKFNGFQGVTNLSTPGGKQQVNVINEKGLYMFLFASELPKAVEFQKQVAELLENIRKGNVSIQQKQDDRLQMQKQRAEAMLLNARTRQAKLIEGMASKFNSKLSDTAVQALLSHSTFLLTGERIIPKPQIKEKHYTATEIAKEAGTSANKIGRLANANGIKTEQYGKWVLDKSRYSDKQVQSFLYNDLGRRVLINLCEQDRIKRVK